jgi:transcriptional regulator with XRE-family HTH domain
MSLARGHATPHILNRKMPPQNLPRKLKQIRLKAGLSKTTIIRKLNYEAPLYPSDISQYERGERQPPLILVLAYAQLGGTCLCVLTDDELSLD